VDEALGDQIRTWCRSVQSARLSGRASSRGQERCRDRYDHQLVHRAAPEAQRIQRPAGSV